MYGSFIAELRRSRGLSQAQLGSIVGISQPNLSAYERDRRTPTAETLHRIVVACGYQLVATAGRATIPMPLPRVGWFPDDADPPRLPDDPPDERPTVDASTPMDRRVELITAALALPAAVS